MIKKVLDFLYSWYFRSFILSLNAIYLARMTYGNQLFMSKIIPGLLSLGMMYCAFSFYRENKKSKKS